MQSSLHDLLPDAKTSTVSFREQAEAYFKNLDVTFLIVIHIGQTTHLLMRVGCSNSPPHPPAVPQSRSIARQKEGKQTAALFDGSRKKSAID